MGLEAVLLATQLPRQRYEARPDHRVIGTHLPGVPGTACISRIHGRAGAPCDARYSNPCGRLHLSHIRARRMAFRPLCRGQLEQPIPSCSDRRETAPQLWLRPKEMLKRMPRAQFVQKASGIGSAAGVRARHRAQTNRLPPTRSCQSINSRPGEWKDCQSSRSPYCQQVNARSPRQ